MTHPQTPPSAPLLAEFPILDTAAWRQEVDRLLKGAPYARKMVSRTLEGIDVDALYTGDDTAALPWSEQFPGQAPYLRGPRAGGYLAAPWLVAQELPLPTVQEFHAALTHDLARGQTAVNLILDQAARHGLDPDQAPAGMVGLEGTSVASLADLEIALAGVDLAATPLLMQAGSALLPAAALVVALVRKRGGRAADLTGCWGCDPVAGVARRDDLPLSAERVYDELGVLTRWALRRAPGLRTLPVYEDPWHDGGADSALSLGLILATAVSALRAMIGRGLEPAAAAAQIQFHLCVGSDFFMEMAKVRALRLLWSDVQTAAGFEPVPPRIHARTSRRTRTVHDPHVNLLRSTTQALAAVLAGVDSLHVAPFDEVDSLPDGFSRRLARNTQLLLAHESRCGQVADPAGGSHYVETLTARLAEAAWERFRAIESEGGILAALGAGTVQAAVVASAEARRQRLATRRDVLVGTNRFADPGEAPRPPRTADLAAIHARRAAEVAAQRTGEADRPKVVEELGRMLDSQPAELFEHMTAAAALGATLGELQAILRHDDEPDPPLELVPTRRDAAPFEALRARVTRLRADQPRSGRVFCACLGKLAPTLARLDFTKDFFRVGGCEVVDAGFHADPASAARAAADADAATVVMVALDDVYAAQGEALAAALKALAPAPHLVVAGRPPDAVDGLEAAGVDEFIHAGSDVLDVLGRLAERLEVTP